MNAEATWLKQTVVTDEGLVTARGPQDLPAFIPSMIDLFDKGRAESTETIQAEESDGPALEAPMLVQRALNFVSGFPYKWAAGAALFALGAYGAATKKGFRSEMTYH